METVTNIDLYLGGYRHWLKNVKCFEEKTISSRMSNIKVIARNYNILEEFAVDECDRIFDDLSFSKDDFIPKTSIEIEGDYYKGLATYKTALKRFVEYLKYIGYTAPPVISSGSCKFIGSFDEFKRYVGPFSKNEVNRFCRKSRNKQKGICEWCGKTDELQSAHIKERPAIVKALLDRFYKIGPDLYEVNLKEFFEKFEAEHLPVEDHIFFLCKKCHDDLDKRKIISVSDIIAKRALTHSNRSAKAISLGD